MKQRRFGKFYGVRFADLNAIGEYSREGLETLAKLFGSGRVFGLETTPTSGGVQVSPGVALFEQDGRSVLARLSNAQTIGLGDQGAGSYYIVATWADLPGDSIRVDPPPQVLQTGQPNPFYNPNLAGQAYDLDRLIEASILLSVQTAPYTPPPGALVLAEVLWDGTAATVVAQADYPAPKVGNRTIAPIKLADSVAGAGLVRDAVGGLAVNPDNSSLEVAGDTLQVKDSGVSDAKLGARTIAQNTTPADSGTLSNLLSGLANRIKALSGKTDWKTSPRTTLELAAARNQDETITGQWTFANGTTTFAKSGGNVKLAFTGSTPGYIAHVEGSGQTELRIALSGSDNSATDRLLVGSDLSGIFRARVALDTRGYLSFAGSSGAFDTNLYRATADTLKTDDSLSIGTNLSVQGSTALNTLTVSAAATFSAAASVGGNLSVAGNLTVSGNTTLGNAANDVITIKGGAAFEQGVNVAGALGAASLSVSGPTTLGTANASALTLSGNLTASGASISGAASVGGALTVSGNATLGAGASASHILRGSLTLQDGGNLNLGSDVRLYRGGADTLRVDDLVQVARSGLAFEALMTGDTQGRFAVGTDGVLSWGPGNAARDVSLARTAGGQLTLSGNLVTGGSVTANYLTINPQNGSNEGAELRLKGSGSYPDWYVDVYQNSLRLVTQGQARATFSPSGVNLAAPLTVSGYGVFSSFVRATSNYGDTLEIGGDNAGNDYELRLSNPARKLTVWSPSGDVSLNVQGTLQAKGRTLTDTNGYILPQALPAIGNYGRWVEVSERIIWGDAATPFVVEVKRSDGWFELPRIIFAPNYFGIPPVRSGWTRRFRVHVQYTDSTRGVYNPAHTYWDGGVFSACPWLRLLDVNSNELWITPLVQTWGGFSGTREFWLDVPEAVSSAFEGHIKLAIGLWWDANSPSWPTANIAGDSVGNNYQNYGKDAWIQIHRIRLVAYDVMP